MVVVLCALLLLLVALVLLSPWRRTTPTAEEPDDRRLREAAGAVLELEASRDAKYREIRDAELDRETGHLSDADFASIDSGLRAEAIEILKRLDRAQARLKKLQATLAEEAEAAAEQAARTAAAEASARSADRPGRAMLSPDADAPR